MLPSPAAAQRRLRKKLCTRGLRHESEPRKGARIPVRSELRLEPREEVEVLRDVELEHERDDELAEGLDVDLLEQEEEVVLGVPQKLRHLTGTYCAGSPTDRFTQISENTFF